MRKIAYPLMLLLGCCLGSAVIAQHDTTHLDLGYTKIDKKFTQQITIRGADLEKMPFTNLSDAIAAWLYGGYSKPYALVYLVDGNPVSDVNAYSVFDIEEVTLVQDASAAMGFGGGQQQMVLVTTRRGKGKRGITASAQTGVVNSNVGDTKTNTGGYHQYYIGGYQNLDKVSFGLSAGFQRDIFPMPKPDNTKINTPLNLQRWRLNGYFDWRINSRNLVEIGMNYTPQHVAAARSNTINVSKGSSKAPQNVLLPNLRWHSEIAPGLTNDLQGSYMGAHYNLHAEQVALYYTDQTQTNIVDNKNTSEHWRVRDRLAVVARAGDWRIEPALNFLYEHLAVSYSSSNLQTIQFSIPNTLPAITSNSVTSKAKGHYGVLTPSVGINYKKLLNIEAGLLMNLSTPVNGGKKELPYVRAGIDLLQFGKTERNNSLNLFGSYARRNLLFSNGLGLTDLNTSTSLVVIQGLGTNMLSPVTVPTISNASYWAWEGGVTYSTANQRVKLQYSIERRNLSLPGYIAVGNAYVPFYREWRSIMHHLDVRVKVVDRANLRWETGLNLTLLHSKPKSTDIVATNFYYTVLGEWDPNGYSPTGGWVNRVEVHKFIAGLDLLYQFHETPATTYGNSNVSTDPKVNSILIPNVYAGYRSGGWELFAESRGLYRNKKQDITDMRKYYTLGAKVNLQ